MTGSTHHPAEIDWNPGEPPRSRVYGDVYFSRDDGLAEARAVFLAGCDLPDAWSAGGQFTVGELGCGTGLNIVALFDLWRRTRSPGGRLTVFSIEAHLMTRAEASRALSTWSEVAETAAMLLDRWPRAVGGFQRLDFEEIGAVIDLAVMDAGDALRAWSGPADAWFLDGFSPALNPQMWQREVIDLIAARSAPGARLATYTVASAVRRDLAEAGFDVERKPGFGRKRERLEARSSGTRVIQTSRPRVAIIGGGIAAASLHRAFAAQGVDAQVFADLRAGTNASSGPAALVAPRLDAGLGAAAALFAQAFHRATNLYGALAGSVISTGVLQLATEDRDEARFAKIAASSLFDPAATHRTTAERSQAVLGEPSAEGLMFDDAVVVRPAVVLSAWLGHPIDAKVATVTAGPRGWRLESEAGDMLFEADAVIIAGGFASNDLAPSLGLKAVRGQASWTEGQRIPTAALFGGYVISTDAGVMFGATHDRDDTAVETRDADHARNLATLAEGLPHLANTLKDRALQAHVGVRAATKDFMPLAGALGDGFYVLAGLGSRGFCLAPLLAEHVVALALDTPSPLPRAIVELVDPGRFADREKRRGWPGVNSRMAGKQSGVEAFAVFEKGVASTES